MAKIYALYKGDEYITDGTLRELSKKTGKKEATLKFMTTPAYEGRIGEKALRLVCLGEEYYKKCVVCGKEFRVTALQKSRLYCSDTCKRKVKRERDRRAAAAKGEGSRHLLVCQKVSGRENVRLAGKCLSQKSRISGIARRSVAAMAAGTEVRC